MLRFRTFWLALLAAIALGASTLGMAAASATTTGHRGDGEHHRLRPINVEINLVTDYIDGTTLNDAGVLGPGRLRLAGADTTLSPAFDRLSDGVNGFDIEHGDTLGTGVEDPVVCQIRFTDDDQFWRGFDGLGTYRGLRTFRGLYDLTAVFSFGPDRRGDCSLGDLSVGDAISAVQGGTAAAGGVMRGALRGTEDNAIAGYCHRHHLPVPVLLNSSVTVQATALASVRHRERPKPYVTPSATPSVTATA